MCRLHFDDIIFQLQRGGGASVYWREMTTRVAADSAFQVIRERGSKWQRVLPVPTSAQVFHSSHFRVPLSKRVPCVTTIYDLTYELGLIKTRGSALNIWERKHAAYRADAIICISESTKRDLLTLYPDLSGRKPIHAIPLASSFIAADGGREGSSRRIEKLMTAYGGRYVLYNGTRAHYKNFNAALDGFGKSKLPADDFALVCTGPGFTEDDGRVISEYSLVGKVISVDRASEPELRRLYSSAFALVYPSRYEGFGLPALEAIASGCPAIVANASALPEVVGDAGILIHPDHPEEIAHALDSLLDGSVRAAWVARGLERAKHFSWEKTAELHKAVYRSLVSSI